MFRIELLVDARNDLGEGPLWDIDEQRLYWIDVADGRVFRCTADGRELRAWDMPEPIGSLALRRGGGAVVSLASGFHFLDFNTGDDLDPSHITLLNKDMLRLMFVLEGCRSRPDLEARMDWGKKGRVLVLQKQ